RVPRFLAAHPPVRGLDSAPLASRDRPPGHQVRGQRSGLKADSRCQRGYGEPVVDPADRTLRGIFDEDAELYHRIRPGYPAELYDDLAELAGIGPGCRLLEIGPGTGKATVELA